MSHKEKLCQPAVTSHIEVCHDQCSYTPLIITREFWKPMPRYPGIKTLVEAEIEKMLDPRVIELKTNVQKLADSLRENINDAFDETCKKKDKKKVKTSLPVQDLKSATFEALNNEIEHQLGAAISDARLEVVEESEGRLDLNDPEKAIEMRESDIRHQLDEFNLDEIGPIDIPHRRTFELEGLGLFFKESVCYRPDGKTYSICGDEITILPGEEISERNVLKTTTTNEEGTEQTTTENITTTGRNEENETFSESYDETVKRETDINFAREASFGGKVFKKFNLDLSASGSFDYNRLITEVNKSSHTSTQKRFHEVVRKLSVTNTTRSSSTSTVSQEVAFNRTWKNNTDKPLTYIKRKSYCKTTVLHKRHNVHLAWSGCIENPARDLCTPGNIREKYASEIREIIRKWNAKPVPSSFGPRPAPRKVCTGFHRAQNGALHIGPSNFRQSFQYTIPSGWSYENLSASVDVGAHSSAVLSTSVVVQPPANASGGVSFTAQVLLDNRFPKKEVVEFRVCFNILPAAARDWDERVQAWRDEQAQQEIEAFIADKESELNQFLASAQARATIERRIMEDYFGVTPIRDCCRLIARLKKLFDFDAMCYSLLPSWNALGEGCQRAFPVNLYTAQCLHFYVPIRPGMEREAIGLLASVNAIPWNWQIANQVFQYIGIIQNRRANLYNRQFDPTGWDVKFDQPKGYELTPYDTSNQNWSAAHESGLNYELLGAFTINVPCGERIDCRPPLCC